jgi:hypothetical protein
VATLILTKLWVNLMATGEVDYVAAWHDPDDTDTRAVTGRVAQYAGGRQRGITQAGVTMTWPFTLRQVTATDTDKLSSWMGQTVLVRDNRGRRTWGVVLACPRRPWKEQLDLYDVELSLQGVDVVEDV